MTGARSGSSSTPSEQLSHSLHRVALLLQSACDEQQQQSTARSSMSAISEVIMGSMTAAPGELTPPGMMCRGRRAAWTDAKG